MGSTRFRKTTRRGLVDMLATVLAVPAALSVATVTASVRAAHADPSPNPAASAEATASAQAVATGKPVPVDADTSAYTDTVANPDGSFTFTANHQPQHAYRDGRWVTPDATLHVNSNGTVAPNASATGLTLSGGGTGPLATFDDNAGRTLSLTLPFTLPKPGIAGATATYASVLPGVDLSVTASIDGGMKEVLVVHDAAAAANPALASLRFATATTGLTLVTDPGGAISANDSGTGRAVFAAPPPLMWDSTTPSPARAQALTRLAQADPVDAPPAASSASGPGVAAQLTTIPVRAATGAFTLSPPTSALTGAGVTYPLYIDPMWSNASNPDAYTQSWHTGTTAYNPTDDLRTGFDDWTNEPYQNGITRSYLVYNIRPVVGKYIQEAHLQLTEVATSDPSTSNYYEVQVSDTSPWSSNLTWANQPGFGAITDVAAIPGVPRGQTHDYQIGVTDMINYGLGRGWGGIYMVMHMGDEQNHMKYKHWGLNPSLVVTYWSTPDAPANLTQINGTQTTPCTTTSPGTWVPAATGNTITLHYTVSTVDTGTPLAANTYVATNGGGYTDYSTVFNAVGAGANPVDQQLSVTDGTSYQWYARSNNPYVWSTPTPASGACYFRYDATTPTTPVATSTAYPTNGPTTVATGGSGTISFSSTDAGPNPSGIAGYNYNLGGTSITSGGTGQQYTTATSLSVPLSSLHWGTNTLWLQAKDNAGNLSQPLAYSFYVQQSAFGAYTPGTAGDLDGDNNPDLVTVDAAGNVRLFSHPDAVSVNPTGNTTTDPLQYGGRVIIPYNQDTLWPGASFAGALVTHGGSFGTSNTDDLLIEQAGNLAVAKNLNGNASSWQLNRITKPSCSTCANYNSQDWSSVIQMIAVPTTPGGRPNLLTLEYVNNVTNLWLYPPTTSGSPGFTAPTLISTDYADFHWEGTQLVAATPLPGGTGTTLLIHEIANGTLDTFANITAGLSADPASLRTIIATGYSATAYPLITSTGRADAAGNLPLWTTTATGGLAVIPTATNGGTTTVGRPALLGANGWASHETALGSTYASENNLGIVTNGTVKGTSFDGRGYFYSIQSLGTATLGSGVTTACPPSWTATCPIGVAHASSVTVPLANGTYTFTMPPATTNAMDNYAATGQVMPAPLDPNFAPAQYIAFLGSASATSNAGVSGTATITYTDGHTQQITVTLSDWVLGGASNWSPAAGNTIVATAGNRVVASSGATDPTPNYLFATAETELRDNGAALPNGVQIASITLPANSAIHIFGIAVN